MVRRNGGKVSKTLQVLMEMRDSLQEIRGELADHRRILEEHGEILKEHTEILTEHTKILTEHTKILVQHAEVLGGLLKSVEGLNGRIDNILLGPHRDEHQDLRHRVERIERHLGLDG